MALEDTAHQTFSTVPEVLAGLVALLGAFALFRLGGLQRRITELGEGVLTVAGLGPEIVDRVRTAFAEHRRAVIHHELAELEPYISEDLRSRYERAKDRLDRALIYRKRLIGRLSTAMWVNVLVMAGSVFLLVLTQPLMDAGTALVYTAMTAVAFGLVASMIANTRVLYLLLDGA